MSCWSGRPRAWSGSRIRKRRRGAGARFGGLRLRGAGRRGGLVLGGADRSLGGVLDWSLIIFGFGFSGVGGGTRTTNKNEGFT